MKYNSDIHHRRSIRLRNYDYSQAGAYFVTICTQNKDCLFGNISDGEMKLSEMGIIAAQCWDWLSGQYEYVDLDAYIVMPNHMHGILVINNSRGGSRTAHDNNDACEGDTVDSEGGSRTAPTIKRKSVGRLVGAFKTVSSKNINQIRNSRGIPVWQRNYHEHVIRNENELNNIRQYIVNNPFKWEEDENFVDQ
jgi:putative transposase